jgi:uncharacterized protein with HEPN domain
MKSSDYDRLDHIEKYCAEIEETITRFGADYDIFSADTDYRKSVSLSILEIGELSAGLSDEFKDSTRDSVQWGPIKAMRNLVAHSYRKMDVETVWETATKDIPKLREFCKITLKKADEK